MEREKILAATLQVRGAVRNGKGQGADGARSTIINQHTELPNVRRQGQHARKRQTMSYSLLALPANVHLDIPGCRLIDAGRGQLHRAAAEERSRARRGCAAQLGRLRNLGNQVAFAGGEKQIGIYSVLARVQSVVTALKSIERRERAALRDAATLHPQDLLGSPDGGEAMRDSERGAAFH